MFLGRARLIVVSPEPKPVPNKMFLGTASSCAAGACKNGASAPEGSVLVLVWQLVHLALPGVKGFTGFFAHELNHRNLAFGVGLRNFAVD